MTVLELREKAASEAEEARAIKDKADQESRGLTEDEATAFDKHLREAERIEKEADRQERLEATEARLNKPKPTATKPELADGKRIELLGPKLFRYGELRAFKGPQAEMNAYRSGRFLAATIFQHAGSRQWCRDHGIELRIDSEIDERAMAEGINTAGGFLVPDEFEQSIIDLREQYGDARRECRVKPMASDHVNEPKKTGGLTAYAVGENASLTESEQTWGNVELTARKWAVLTRVSTELSEDTLINLADDLALAMKATAVRIVAPVPGKDVVGIEVPNVRRETVYLRDLLEAKNIPPLPTYTPIPSHEKMGADELILTTYKVSVHIHSRSANCKWLTEIYHDNPGMINSKTAKRLGIKTGDKIKVKSEIGEITTTANVTEAVVPGVIAISHHLGHWEYGRYACGKKAPMGGDNDPDFKLKTWNTYGVHPNWIIPNRPDPVSGQQSWMDTVVKVTKA